MIKSFQKFLKHALTLIFVLVITGVIHLTGQQSCYLLLQKAPLLPESVGKAFTGVKLELVVEYLDDGTEFKRVKAWAPTFDQKQFEENLSKYVERWELQAQENSFALNYNPDTTKEVGMMVKEYQRMADTIMGIWEPVSKKARNLDPEFMVLSEMDYGCDEIRQSANRINELARKQNELLSQARMQMSPAVDRFQRYFNKLEQIEDPLMNNAILSQMSRVLGLLEDWNLIVSSTHSNLVETGVSLNNGLCRPDKKE